MKNSLLIDLHKQRATVFTLKDITLLFPEIPYKNLKKNMAYFAKTGSIKKLSRGVYAKDHYDVLELANKLYTPSYISLESVLKTAGVVFQYDSRIFAASYLSRTIKVNGRTIEYRRLPKEILLNHRGLEIKNEVVMAMPERAFLDAVYLYKDHHFDNLSVLNWDKVMELKSIYKNRALERRLKDYARQR